MTDLTTTATVWLQPAKEVAVVWLLSPAAWARLSLLVRAYLLARLINARALPVLTRALNPPEGPGLLAKLRRLSLRFPPLMLPLLACALTAAGEGVPRQLFDSGAVLALGKLVFLFLAARQLAQKVLPDGFLHVLGRFVLVSAAALYALGVLVPALEWLDQTEMALDNINFSVLSLLRGALSAAILFWLSSGSNRQSADYIKRENELRPATRALAVKAVEDAIFGVSFLLLMKIMRIDRTAVAVMGGALGVGIGLGLQKIAAKFGSGLILPSEGQTMIGDYVELDGGEAGTIIKMTARACVLQTFDGLWIVVPNDHFITSRVTNYTREASLNRYKALFSMSYETDLNRVPDIIADAVAALPFGLAQPDRPACDLKSFGDSVVTFGVEFWVKGVGGGQNKSMSPVRFAIWNVCKTNGIEMRYPHRVIEIKGHLHG